MQLYRDSYRKIVTPEHVEIELSPAGLGSRFLALLVDTTLILAIIVVLNFVLGLLPLAGIAVAIFITTTFLVHFGYHVWFELRAGGRTPGKRFNRLRVVDDRGLPITVEQSFIRNVARAVDFLPFLYGVGALAVLVSRDGRRLGDQMARTLVIEERSEQVTLRSGAHTRSFRALQSPKVLRYARNRVGLEERELLAEIALRHAELDERHRIEIMDQVGEHFRAKLEIDKPELSNTNLVLGLAEIVMKMR